MPESYELIAVELPGHGNRMDEKPFNDYEQLMDILIPKLNDVIHKPFSIYGHSMGGLIAFETASILQTRYNKVAENLIVSGTPYLYKYENVLINTLIENNATDHDLRKLIPGISDMTNKEIANQIVKTIRSDFELIFSYHYNNPTIIDTNIIAVHAEDDDRVEKEFVLKWKLGTNKSFDYFETQGGHSFVYGQGSYVAEIVKHAITQELKPKKVTS
jgi:surfactin synthase thioesterase subunit